MGRYYGDNQIVLTNIVHDTLTTNLDTDCLVFVSIIPDQTE